MWAEWEARLEILRQTIYEAFEYPKDSAPIIEVWLFYDDGCDANAKSKKQKRK